MFKNIPALFSLLACLGAATAQSQSIVATPTWYYTGCTGQIHVDLSISGGIGPYDVYWSCALGNNSGSSQGASVDFNIGGEYLVLIQDFGNLTSAYADYTTLSIIVGLDAVVTHSSCDGDGGIDLTPPPDLPPPLQYFWNGPNGFNAQTEDLSGLVPGRYWVQVLGSNGCTRAAVYNVQGTPVEIQTTVTPNSLWCSPFQGSIDATISGGTTPYTYEWSNGSTTEDISNLWPNLFWLRVTDANGCSTISNWILVPWGQVPEVVGQVTPSCFGVGTGSIDIDVSGGSPPYTFDWWSGAGFTSTAEDLSGLSSNGYILDITDANGCSAQYSFYVPLDEDYMELSATVTNTASCGQGGAIDLTVIGGQVPYDYQWGWQPGGSASTEDIEDLYSGTYHVQVTDEIGCRV